MNDHPWRARGKFTKRPASPDGPSYVPMIHERVLYDANRFGVGHAAVNDQMDVYQCIEVASKRCAEPPCQMRQQCDFAERCLAEWVPDE